MQNGEEEKKVKGLRDGKVKFETGNDGVRLSKLFN